MKARVKICGIKTFEEARDALDAGADALGFVFTPKSKRCLNPEEAHQIMEKLPPFAVRVGVFQDQEKFEVQELATFLKLDVLQLHGSETPHYCRGFFNRLVKSVGVRPGMDLKPALEAYQDRVDALLLDTLTPGGLTGGSGQTFDWEQARGLAAHYTLILAGGLTPDNVAEAVQKVRPYAVDVASGVELNGQKNKILLERFVEEVKHVEFTR